MKKLLPDYVLRELADFNGVQTGVYDEPLFEVWTLNVTISPDLIARSTYARHSIETALLKMAQAA